MYTNPKKITIISSYFAPAWAYGGPPKVLFTLAKTLVKRGISVDVITSDSLGERRADKLSEDLEKVKIFRFRNLSNFLAYKANFFYTPGILSKIEKLLFDTELVLFADVRNIFNWQIYKYLKKKNIPYGIFAFGEIPYSGRVKSLIKKIFDLLWVRDYVKNAAFRFAQTEHEREMFKLYFGIAKSDIDLLPLPVEKIPIKPNPKKIMEFRKKWNIGLNNKVIIFIGRINYLKGIDILIKSCENLLISDRQIKLLIIGRDDGYLINLKTLISNDINDQIIFTGPLYGEEANVAFSISSCFVITSRFYEETSTASLEAMSCGIPVVVTRETEIPYLRDYKAGFLIDNNRIDISNAINKILSSSPGEKRQMKSEAIRCIQDHFLVEKVAKQLLDILSRIK